MRWKIVAATAVGALMAVGTVADATAAPTAGSTARDVIARLQADGHRVVVNKVGNAPLERCLVTSVGPVTTRPLPLHPRRLIIMPNLQPRTTVHVAVRC